MANCASCWPRLRMTVTWMYIRGWTSWTQRMLMGMGQANWSFGKRRTTVRDLWCTAPASTRCGRCLTACGTTELIGLGDESTRVCIRKSGGARFGGRAQGIGGGEFSDVSEKLLLGHGDCCVSGGRRLPRRRARRINLGPLRTYPGEDQGWQHRRCSLRPLPSLSRRYRANAGDELEQLPLFDCVAEDFAFRHGTGKFQRPRFL